ncbi:MAG: TetR/AcrR family transcriptional regulator [Polyangiales bacterium]
MARSRRIAGRRERRIARRRRSPEEARLEILDAADRVFIEFQPDQVGLKDVGREAGVSHALITHYFGTFAGLIEAALERRISKLRETMLERLRQAGALSRPSELIGILFAALEDPVHLRLMRWLLASERPSAAYAFGLQAQGLQVISRQVATALDPAPSAQMIDKVELALLTAVSAAYGYALAKYALVGGLGRQASAELDAEVQKTLAAMVQAHIRAELGITIGR